MSTIKFDLKPSLFIKNLILALYLGAMLLIYSYWIWNIYIFCIVCCLLLFEFLIVYKNNFAGINTIEILEYKILKINDITSLYRVLWLSENTIILLLLAKGVSPFVFLTKKRCKQEDFCFLQIIMRYDNLI